MHQLLAAAAADRMRDYRSISLETGSSFLPFCIHDLPLSQAAARLPIVDESSETGSSPAAAAATATDSLITLTREVVSRSPRLNRIVGVSILKT